MPTWASSPYPEISCWVYLNPSTYLKKKKKKVGQILSDFQKGVFGGGEDGGDGTVRCAGGGGRRGA